MEFGFSKKDIESLYLQDSRNFFALVKEIDKKNSIKRILFKLDISEAVNYAIVGSAPKGGQHLKKWRQSQINDLRILLGQKIQTIWDRMPKRKSKRI